MRAKNNKVILTLASAFLLGACGGTGGGTAESSAASEASVQSEATQSITESTAMGHDMEHDQSGELPGGLQEAESPAYAVGQKIMLHTDHMPGMEGAKGTVVGAFDTVAYEVSYTPTDGGEPVENHKWVVAEEIKEADGELLEPGTEVTLEANHMPGMEGATATIDSYLDTTVYMVDYEDTETGEMIRNHKWVTGDELAPAE